MRERRQIVLDTAQDLVAGFLYYDRKEDSELPLGAIEEAIKNEEITIDDITYFIKEKFEESLGELRK